MTKSDLSLSLSLSLSHSSHDSCSFVRCNFLQCNFLRCNFRALLIVIRRMCALMKRHRLKSSLTFSLPCSCNKHFYKRLIRCALYFFLASSFTVAFSLCCIFVLPFVFLQSFSFTGAHIEHEEERVRVSNNF